jgi:hypothetical protein
MMIDKYHTEEDLRLARINLVHAQSRLANLESQNLLWVDDDTLELHNKRVQWHKKSVERYTELVANIEKQLNERLQRA